MDRQQAVRVVAFAVGAFNLMLGVWAFIHPASFFERLAAFPPYNHHLLHDIGAFQVGVGAVLLAALRVRDALLAALIGAGAASVLHAASHIIDRDLGGRATDPIGVSLIAAAVLLAALWRARAGDEEPSDQD